MDNDIIEENGLVDPEELKDLIMDWTLPTEQKLVALLEMQRPEPKQDCIRQGKI